MPDNKFVHESGCKEAVCIDAGRVYDSCSDKDCLEDLRVYFTARDQEIVDNAVSVRARRAEVITTYIDVEALPFNRGYYSCDLTFFFEISVDVYTGRTCPCTTVTGVGVFQKKVILYGSEGNVKVFSSEYREDDCDAQELPTRNLPRCVVHVAEPVVLSARIAEPCSCGCCDCGCGCGCGCIPAHICNRYGGNFCDNADSRNIYVTLGIFTIVQLIRNVQMLVPVYDFCMPSKECSCPATDSPCDLFRKMSFPVDEFFPPKESHGDCGCGCSCSCEDADN